MKTYIIIMLCLSILISYSKRQKMIKLKEVLKNDKNDQLAFMIVIASYIIAIIFMTKI